LPDVIQSQAVPHIGKSGVETRTQVYSQTGLDQNSFLRTLKSAGV